MLQVRTFRRGDRYRRRARQRQCVLLPPSPILATGIARWRPRARVRVCTYRLGSVDLETRQAATHTGPSTAVAQDGNGFEEDAAAACVGWILSQARHNDSSYILARRRADCCNTSRREAGSGADRASQGESGKNDCWIQPTRRRN